MRDDWQFQCKHQIDSNIMESLQILAIIIIYVNNDDIGSMFSYFNNLLLQYIILGD